MGNGSWAGSICGTDRHQLISIVTRGHRLGRTGNTPWRSWPGNMPNRPGRGFIAIPARGMLGARLASVLP